MSSCLFYGGETVDELYKWVRDDSDAVNIKNELESMWKLFKPFADRDFKKSIRDNFVSSLWEMYLAASLLKMEFTLLPRDTHSPDICLDLGDSKCWIECVMPTAGEGDDKIPERKIGEGGIVPEREITLRFTNSITGKAQKFSEYVEKGIVDQNDLKMIAVNGGLISKRAAFFSLGLYLYKCLYGVGDLFVTYDRQTGETSEPRWNRRSNFEKASGQQVGTRLFGSLDFQDISAVLYASSTTSFPYKYGHDLVMHHNPLATNPTKVGFLQHGLDFYVDKPSGYIRYNDRSGLVDEHGDYFVLYKMGKP